VRHLTPRHAQTPENIAQLCVDVQLPDGGMKPRKNLENIHLGEKLAAINSINSWTKRARMDQMKLIFWMIIDLQEAAIQLHKD